MDYIIFYCICQEVFEIFMAGVWFLWVETNASKTKNRYKLAYPSCLLKKDVEVNSLSLLSEHWFAFSKRPRCFPTFKQCQQTTTSGARCQNRTALLVPKTRVLPLHFILHINGAPCRNRTHFRCLQNNCSSHWANGAYILYEPYVHSAFIE